MMLIPCLWGRLDNASVVMGAGAWGSLLPAVWSFMLALRERGLGSAWTTIHLMNDGEQRGRRVARHPLRQGHARPGCSRSPTPSAPTSSWPSVSRSTRSSTGTRGDDYSPMNAAIAATVASNSSSWCSMTLRV